MITLPFITVQQLIKRLLKKRPKPRPFFFWMWLTCALIDASYIPMDMAAHKASMVATDVTLTGFCLISAYLNRTDEAQHDNANERAAVCLVMLIYIICNTIP